MLSEDLRRQLGYLLWLERAKQNKDMKWTSEKSGISLLSMDYLEHGKGHYNWELYQKLLDLYGKEVRLILTDKSLE